jgi:glycosyltransferase involved in cell wall biosynthesis
LHQLRVVILTYDNYPAGGVQRSAAVICQYLRNAGRHVDHWCLRPLPAGSDSLHTDVRPILEWPTERPMGFRQWWRLIRALRETVAREKPDLCIGMDWTPTILLVIATLGLRPRLIGAERSYPGARYLSPSWRILRRFAVARLDMLVCQTQRSVDWYARHHRVPPSRTAVIPNAFPLPPTAKASPLAGLEGLKHRPVIACIGRLAQEKGVEDAIAIFARVAGEDSQACLLLVGDGPLRGELERKSGQLGLADRVLFQPSISGLDRVWPLVDVFLLTSRFEGMPNTLGEAMSHGIACVAFDCPTGPAEMIRNGIDGYLVRPGNVEEAASRCLELLRHDALRERIGEQARELPRRFAADGIGKLWAKLVSSVAHVGQKA